MELVPWGKTEMKPSRVEEEFEDIHSLQGLFRGKDLQQIGVMNGPSCKNKWPRSSEADFDRGDKP